MSETLSLRYPFAAVRATEHTRPRQARSQLQPLPTQLHSAVQQGPGVSQLQQTKRVSYSDTPYF